MTVATYHPLATPHLRWRLLVALRFRDVFTGDVLAQALAIATPTPLLKVVRGASDATWRLIFDVQHPLPASLPPVLPLTVTDPSGAYLDAEPLTVPRAGPALVHMPVMRNDYLIDHDLYPTRLATLATTATTVVGRLIDGGGRALAGRRIQIAAGGAVQPSTPAAFSDAAGEFVVRLPGIIRTPVIRTADLTVAVRQGGMPVAIAATACPGVPQSPSLAAGQVTIRIAQSNLITITTA